MSDLGLLLGLLAPLLGEPGQDGLQPGSVLPLQRRGEGTRAVQEAEPLVQVGRGRGGRGDLRRLA
ncbi:hypothetical protein GCM10023075_21200 [Streptosporangium album]|uniref:hypothetical protein n=1 Tax=Streptosporangium album TaxID=47479 RepID=UPI0031F092B0